MSRARFAAAALALVTTGAAALFVTLAPAQAASAPGVHASPENRHSVARRARPTAG